MNRLKRAGIALARIAAWATAGLALYTIAREIGPLPYATGIILGSTIVLLATCGLAWWIVGRVAETLEHSRQAAQHGMTAAQDAHRALAALREALAAADTPTQPQPVARPTPPGPPTVPATVVIDRGVLTLDQRVHDPAFAHELARLEDQFWTWRNEQDQPAPKPAPVKATARKAAPRKTTKAAPK